ncbi:secreted protein [Culex quinquefasciatus]|uniref:Secreted protein n=1 Tax=Culex quinquefasciatus TaxID=7176 RepID=B0W0H2_CULQU|nr:secreted protein [Culex quinquefasciatus]|eukprot:XP_001842206.1 secreted protein [Culex quinquefasciatus]
MKSLVAFALGAQFLYCVQCFVIPPPGAFGGHPVIPQQYHHYTRPVVYQISYYYNYYGGDQSGAVAPKPDSKVTVITPSSVPVPDVQSDQPAGDGSSGSAPDIPKVFGLFDAPYVCPPGQSADLKGKCKERF